MPKGKARGTPLLNFRCPPELRARLLKYLDGTEHSYDGRKEVTQFIVQAITEKLNHLERSKRKRPAKALGADLVDAALKSLGSV